MPYDSIAPHYDTIFPFRQAVLDMISQTFEQKSSLLDLGCGAGLYPAKLQKMGIKVTGIDLDREMISQAKQTHHEVDYKAMSLLDIDQLQADSFDGAYCIGNVLSYLSIEELETFLRKLHTLLPTSATWLFQVMNWDYILSCHTYQFSDVAIDQSLVFRRFYSDITPKSICFHRQLLDDGKRICHEVDSLTPITSALYIELHKKAGFQLISQFSNFENGKFHPEKDSANLMIFKKI